MGTGQHHLAYDRSRACTCLCGPIAYRGSHIVPSEQDERGGSLTMATIAGFITRDGRDDGPEDEDAVWPFLRVSLTPALGPNPAARPRPWLDRLIRLLPLRWRWRISDTLRGRYCEDVVLDREQIVSLRDYLTEVLDRIPPADGAAPADGVSPLAVG
jgi:hypothetical protein